MRRRGLQIERSFAPILDAGGRRRTTLRGWENLNKRFQLAAAIYNLSQRMRKIFGFGTPKQLAAAMERATQPLFCLFGLALTMAETLIDRITTIALSIGEACENFLQSGEKIARLKIRFLQQAARERSDRCRRPERRPGQAPTLRGQERAQGGRWTGRRAGRSARAVAQARVANLLRGGLSPAGSSHTDKRTPIKVLLSANLQSPQKAAP